jgi:hypothetical protein
VRAGSGSGPRRVDEGNGERRESRPPQAERAPAPELPDDIQYSDLDRSVRARLRTLTKENAEVVGLHLVMSGRLLDADPELAYEHAQAAVSRGGRVDVVREAAGLAAYRTGRYAEALRELRTVRRLNGSSEHLAVMADCERGLGRPERAVALAASPEAEELDQDARIELAIVLSGARLDLGEPDAALAALEGPAVDGAGGVQKARIAQARSTALAAAGRDEEAAAEIASFSPNELAEASGVTVDEDDVVVYDLDEVDLDEDAEDEGEVDADALDADALDEGAHDEGASAGDDSTSTEEARGAEEDR